MKETKDEYLDKKNLLAETNDLDIKLDINEFIFLETLFGVQN